MNYGSPEEEKKSVDLKNKSSKKDFDWLLENSEVPSKADLNNNRYNSFMLEI